MEFIPFTDIEKHKQVLVVDSFHPRGFVLSHWRGAPKLEGLHGETSCDICLNAIRAGLPELDYSYVTNNHFDIDGFLGVWAVMHPRLALSYGQVLREAARIGDFREIDIDSPHWQHALKLVCWLNAVERRDFYAPFGAGELEESEIRLSVEKYRYFLPRFADVLERPDEYRAEWQAEYQTVTQQLSLPIRREHLTDIRLDVVHADRRLHYYALFMGTADADMVLSCYEGNRYELEYKYTTWVDAGRPSYPRIDMRPLADRLNAIESSAHSWQCEKVTDTGPILRLANAGLSKKERYDHPMNREIHPSSIPPERLISEVRAYYRAAYATQRPKPFWSWKQIREVNKELSVALF